MPFVDQAAPVSTGFIDGNPETNPLIKRPPNTDEQAILNDNETPEQAVSRIRADVNNGVQATINAALTDQPDPAQASADIQDAQKKALGVYNADQLYIEDDVVSRTKEYKAAEHLYYRNLQIMSEEVAAATTAQQDNSLVGMGLDLIDHEVIRATLFGWYESLTNRTGRRGADIYSTLLSNNNPTEVRAYAQQLVNDARSEGIFTSDNVFAYGQLLKEAYGAGFNPDLEMDRVFGTLDLLGAVEAVGGIAKIAKVTKLGSLRATTTAGRAGVIGGAEEANKVAAKVALKDADPIALGNMQSGAVDLNRQLVGPSEGLGRKLDLERSIIDDIAQVESKGGVVTTANQVDVLKLAKDASDELAKTFNSVIYKTFVHSPDSQTRVLQTTFGTKSVDTAGVSVPFKATKTGKAPSGAKKLAVKIGGEVVPVDPQDVSKGFVVSYQETLNLAAGVTGGLDYKLINSKWHQTLGKIFDNPFIASAATRDVRELNELALRSQAAGKYMAIRGAKEQEVLDKLGYHDMNALNTVLSDLRDGAGRGVRRQWSETDFKAAWKTLYKEAPSKKVIEAFNAANSLSDASFFFKAQEIMKTYVSKGFRNAVEVEEGVFFAAKRTSLKSLKDDAKIFDPTDGSKLRKVDFKQYDPDMVVWELQTPFNGQDYIVKTRARGILPEDVLGYSAYGRRTNKDARYFVFHKDTDGLTRVMLSAFSEKSAKLARDQFRNIQKALKDGKSGSVVDDIIQQNNDWNPNINSLSDYEKWLKDEQLDTIGDGEIFLKARDESIDDPFDKVFSGQSAGDHINYSKSRREVPLTEFGGAKTYNDNPLQSIVKDYSSAAHRYANSFYTLRAMKGWIEQTQLLVKDNVSLKLTLPDNVAKNDFYKMFMGAKIEGTGSDAARMRELQNIIKHRLSMTTDLENKISTMVDSTVESLYDAWGIKFNPGNPTHQLLKVGYFSAFSFNISQSFLQSSQILNIGAIAGAKVTFDGFAMSTHLRKVLAMSADAATEAQGIKNIGKTFGLAEKDAFEIAELFRGMRPNEVMGDSIELGTGLMNQTALTTKFGKAGFAATKFGDKLFKFGMKPFNLGEANSKSTGFMVAALEFKRAHPNLSVMSDAGRNFIARRSETLTQNMSNTSRSAIQTGLGKVPTQWLSYFFRTMEQVFVGRDLTKAERARLGLMTIPFFGFTGLGVPFAAEKAAEWLGLDPTNDKDKALFITMKYGILDGFLNYFTPFDVALSTRMAPITAVTDIYKKFTEETAIQAFGGPSGSIAYTGIEAVFNLMSNLAEGHTSTLTEDSLRVLRNFSGINGLAKAIGIYQDGVYRNRNGLALPVEMDMTDAILSVTGFTPIQVTEFYAQTGRAIDLAADFKALKKEVSNKSSLAWSIYKDNPERAKDMLEEARVLIAKSPLSLTSKMNLVLLLRPNESDYTQIIRTLYDNDKRYAGDWAKQMLQKD